MPIQAELALVGQHAERSSEGWMLFRCVRDPGKPSPGPAPKFFWNVSNIDQRVGIAARQDRVITASSSAFIGD
jgi:hypothetical protein